MHDQAPGEVLSRGLFFAPRLRECLLVSIALHVLVFFWVQDVSLEPGGRFPSSAPKSLVVARLSDSRSNSFAKALSRQAISSAPGGVAVQQKSLHSKLSRNQTVDSVEYRLSESSEGYIAQLDSIRRYRISLSRMLRSHKLFALMDAYSGSSLSVRYVISKSKGGKEVFVKRVGEQSAQGSEVVALDAILKESVVLVSLPPDLQMEGFSVELDISLGKIFP